MAARKFRTTLSLPQESADAIRALAFYEGIPLNQAVADAINFYVAHRERMRGAPYPRHVEEFYPIG